MGRNSSRLVTRAQCRARFCCIAQRTQPLRRRGSVLCQLSQSWRQICRSYLDSAANVTPNFLAYYPRSHWAIEMMLSQPEYKDLAWTSLQPNGFLPMFLSPSADFIKNYRKTGKQGTLSMIIDASTPTGLVDSDDVGRYAHNRGASATLFQGGPHTVASLINSSNPTLLGRYLRTCFAHRQFVLEHDSISV